MKRVHRFAIGGCLLGLAIGGCSSGEPTDPSIAEASLYRGFGVPDPISTPKRRHAWRKERYISVAEAAARLDGHVDVPVVLPRSLHAGLRNFKGWLADPKYVYWGREHGVRVGRLLLLKRKEMLHISYGSAGFDGCGGRDEAIRTDVSGQPALLNMAVGHVWSDLIWPVTETGSTGRYGLSGTFEGWRMVLLAESMERARSQPIEGRTGCR